MTELNEEIRTAVKQVAHATLQGRISPDKADVWLGCLLEDPEGARSVIAALPTCPSPNAFANKRMTGLNLTDADDRLKTAIERLHDESLAIITVALREALMLGQNHIAPEHILLAIVRDGQSKAAATLADLAGSGAAARKAIIKRLAI